MFGFCLMVLFQAQLPFQLSLVKMLLRHLYVLKLNAGMLERRRNKVKE